MSFWFRDVISEGTYLGNHTLAVQRGLNMGVALFIVSEALFFLGIFWTYFHSFLSPFIYMVQILVILSLLAIVCIVIVIGRVDIEIPEAHSFLNTPMLSSALPDIRRGTKRSTDNTYVPETNKKAKLEHDSINASNEGMGDKQSSDSVPRNMSDAPAGGPGDNSELGNQEGNSQSGNANSNIKTVKGDKNTQSGHELKDYKAAQGMDYDLENNEYDASNEESDNSLDGISEVASKCKNCFDAFSNEDISKHNTEYLIVSWDYNILYYSTEDMISEYNSVVDTIYCYQSLDELYGNDLNVDLSGYFFDLTVNTAFDILHSIFYVFLSIFYIFFSLYFRYKLKIRKKKRCMLNG